MRLLFVCLVFTILFVLFSPICLASESVSRNVYAGSGLVGSISGEGISYFVKDRLTSSRLKIGVQSSEFKSLPFGQQVLNTGIKYGFTGKEQDADSGLHYFSARYYDSDIGRFGQVDLVKENHPFIYVTNNPLNFVDPDGTTPEKVALIYPYGYNLVEDDIHMITSAFEEEGIEVVEFKYDSLRRVSGRQKDILKFADRLHAKGYSEVIITGHGYFKGDSFNTLSSGKKRDKGVEILWEDYISRDWLHDLSCGSVCEFDPYSRFNPFSYLALITGAGRELSPDDLELAENMARGRSLLETHSFIQDRHEIKRIMGAHYGGEDVEIDEYIDAMNWGIKKKFEVDRDSVEPSAKHYDAVDFEYYDPISVDTGGYAVT